MSAVAPLQAAGAEAQPDDVSTKGGRKKLLVVALVLLLVAAGAGYWFFLKPSGPTEPEPGAVVPLDPVQINLAQGHYLSIGIALQLTKSAHEADGSKALDAVIETFSGRRMGELSRMEERVRLKKKLAHELEELYDGEVMQVYFTQFVTQ